MMLTFPDGPEEGAQHSPRMMPLGWAGLCQMSRTELVRTSGNRMPTGGPGTGWGAGSYFLIYCKCFVLASLL